MCRLIIFIFCSYVSQLAFTDTGNAHWLDAFKDDRPLFNEEGYRSRHYRSPTPMTIMNATLIDTARLQKMLGSSQPPLLVDVLPVTSSNGSFIPSKKHYHIRSSLWLPNVGGGELSQEMLDYFSQNLLAMTHGDKSRPIVVYCRADCWMSWNAVKRAFAWGYKTLYWYRDGTDGWREHDLPFVEAKPRALISLQRNNQTDAKE